jgi:hypothetical protein
MYGVLLIAGVIEFIDGSDNTSRRRHRRGGRRDGGTIHLLATNGACSGEGVSRTSGRKASAELTMRQSNLGFELWVPLSETLGDNVIHKTIALFKGMARLLATEANR